MIYDLLTEQQEQMRGRDLKHGNYQDGLHARYAVPEDAVAGQA